MDMFDSETDNKEQVCEFHYFDLSISHVTAYTEYNYIESDLIQFASNFSAQHVSQCVLHVIKRLWQFRGHSEDEDCMYILGEKYIDSSILSEHLSVRCGSRYPLQMSNAYIEVPHSQSVWYIAYYWLRIVRLNYYDWYMDYINTLFDRQSFCELRKILARPTMHIILCMSQEALEFWNFVMCQAHNATDCVFNEYLLQIHHVLLSVYEDALSPLLFTRSAIHCAETHRAFVTMFKSGGVRINIDDNGRSAASGPRRSVRAIITEIKNINGKQTSSVRKRRRSYNSNVTLRI